MGVQAALSPPRLWLAEPLRVLSVHENLSAFLLEWRSRASLGSADSRPAFPWLSSRSELPAVWIPAPERERGLVGEFGSGSKVGSSILVLLAPESCVS